MPPVALVFGLLVFPFFSLIEHSARRGDGGEPLWITALAGLSVSCLLRAAVLLPPKRHTWMLAFVPLALLWSWFYVADLHTARFRWTLMVVPAAAALGMTTWRWPNVALGALAGFTLVWVEMLRRADNGCTGVSGPFSTVLLLHPVLGLFPAPWLIAGDWRARDES